MKLQWTAPLYDGVGNAFGYQNVRKRLHRGLVDSGVQLTDSADVVLHVCEPIQFRPISGKVNILYTMWDSPDLPDDRVAKLDSADLIIVPSQFCRRVFSSRISVPVKVVPLGVDHDVFTFSKRSTPDDNNPFTWLWIGAPNQRKGYNVLGDVWNTAFLSNSHMCLYMKTTGAVHSGVKVRGNVIFDYRTLTDTSLASLYSSAHAFVMPTAGEGFGLCIVEAMATGLPCVVTRCGAVTDYTEPDSVYGIRHEFEPWDVEGCAAPCRFASCDPQSLADQMLKVMGSYRKALIRARRSRDNVKSLSWSNTASCLLSVLKSV